MPKKDERRCIFARIGGAIAGLFACGAAGAGIGIAFPGHLAAITIVSCFLGLIGGFLTADGTIDACSDDDSDKKNEESARIGLVVIWVPFGAFIAITVSRLVLGPDLGYTLEIALTGALAGAIVGDLISRRIRASA